jgi:hypothetical protein
VNLTALVIATDPVALTFTVKVLVLPVVFGATESVEVNTPETHDADAGAVAIAGVTETEHDEAFLTNALTLTSPPSWDTGVEPNVTDVIVGADREVIATATIVGDAKITASAITRMAT